MDDQDIEISPLEEANSAKSIEEFLGNIASVKAKSVRNLDAHEMNTAMATTAEKLGNIATLLEMLGKYDKTIEIRKEEITFLELSLGKDHETVGIVCSRLGKTYEVVYGNYERALEMKQRALDIDISVLGESDPTLAVSYDNLAMLELKMRNYAKADELFLKSLELQNAVEVKDERLYARTVRSRGLMFEEKKEIHKAMNCFKESREILVKYLGLTHPSVALAEMDIGSLLMKWGKNNLAQKYMSRAVDTLRENYAQDSFEVANAENNYGSLFERMGMREEALLRHTIAKGIYVSRDMTTHPDYAATCQNIAVVHHGIFMKQADKNPDKAVDSFSEAYSHYKQASDVYEVVGGVHTDDPKLAIVFNSLGTLCFELATQHPDLLDESDDEDGDGEDESNEKEVSERVAISTPLRQKSTGCARYRST